MPGIVARQEASERSGMRSPRGFLTSVALVLALPVAILIQALLGSGASLTMHVALTVGCVPLSLSAFDFETTACKAWVERVASGVFAAIFLLQAASELIRNDSISYFTLQVLGNWSERVLVTLLVFWLVAVLLSVSRGNTRILGFVVMAVVVGVDAYNYVLLYLGQATPWRRCISCLSYGFSSRAGRESPRRLRSASELEQWWRVPRGRDVRAGSRRGRSGVASQ